MNKWIIYVILLFTLNCFIGMQSSYALVKQAIGEEFSISEEDFGKIYKSSRNLWNDQYGGKISWCSYYPVRTHKEDKTHLYCVSELAGFRVFDDLRDTLFPDPFRRIFPNLKFSDRNWHRNFHVSISSTL